MNKVKARLKGFFNTGDKPTEAQFAELIDRGVYFDENGNLGIGIDEAEAKLHVVGGSDVTPTSGGALVIGELSGQNIALDGNEIMARNQNNADTLHLQLEGGEVRMHDAVADTEVVIRDDGKVGIGTKSPSEKLEVNGKIKTHGIELSQDMRHNDVPVMGFLESPSADSANPAIPVRARRLTGTFINGSSTTTIPLGLPFITERIVGLIPHVIFNGEGVINWSDAGAAGLGTSIKQVFVSEGEILLERFFSTNNVPVVVFLLYLDE
jgi:hypothetical protein